MRGGAGFSTLTLAGFGSREWLLSRISGFAIFNGVPCWLGQVLQASELGRTYL
jgi:hypothetical protein